jgi:hypothetical protein
MAQATDTFLEYLAEANRLVLAKYPKAQFYEADNLTGDVPGSQWRFVFGSPGGTAFIERLERGFGEPYEIKEIWVGDRVIKLPISMGLSDARERCAKSGCGGKNASAIVLRHPLYPGLEEPYYIITMASVGKRCWVGVKTGDVKCEPLTDA